MATVEKKGSAYVSPLHLEICMRTYSTSMRTSMNIFLGEKKVRLNVVYLLFNHTNNITGEN